MDKVALSVQSRPTQDRAKWLLKENLIPGVVYGHGIENIHMKVDYQTFRKVFEKATYSTLVTLDVEGKQIPVLIHDVQYNPVTDKMTHIDFYAVRMDEKVKTHVTLEFVGASEAVKLGAVLNTSKHQVEISALPADLVHAIQVDISVLQKIGDMIRVKDLKVPAGIEILTAGEEPIVSAVELRIVEEEAPVAEAAAAPVEGAAPAEGAAGAAVAEGDAKAGAAKPEAGKSEKKPEKKK